MHQTEEGDIALTAHLHAAQVAGYKQAYTSGLTYATVLGAGHFVPECKPVEALHMITRFLADKLL